MRRRRKRRREGKIRRGRKLIAIQKNWRRRERQRDGNTGRRNEDGDREKEDRIEEGRTLRSGRG